MRFNVVIFGSEVTSQSESDLGPDLTQVKVCVTVFVTVSVGQASTVNKYERREPNVKLKYLDCPKGLYSSH